MLTFLGMEMKTTLQQIISDIETLEWKHLLFVSEGELSLDTMVAVLEDDGVSEEFDGMYLYLSVQDVQSVIENLRAQKNSPSTEQALQAIKHYHANDAFICIPS
jgi:hypothetical protein